MENYLKNVRYLIALVIILITCYSCGNSTKETKLVIEQAVLAMEDTINGTIYQVEEARLKPRESVAVVLINVSGFKKDENGMNQFEMDMEVIDPNGKVAFVEESVLGMKGWQNLKDNIATSPSVLLTVDSKYPPGEYQLVVSIYDLVGTGRATVTKTFEVIADSTS